MLKSAVLLCAIVGFGVAAHADAIDPAKLRRDFTGSVVALRQPLRGAEIVFRPDGAPQPPLVRGTFARDALLRIDDVRLYGFRLQFACHRVILMARANGKGIEFFPAMEKTRLFVDLPSNETASAQRVLDSVFRSSKDTAEVLTNYARAFSQDGVLDDDRRVTRCKLQPLDRPAPYGPANGRFVARVIINERGEPEAIGVLNGPKSKSDEKTFIETLWEWRFAPYQNHGMPSACTATIAMRFVPNTR
jgi:hypothetical protein